MSTSRCSVNAIEPAESVNTESVNTGEFIAETYCQISKGLRYTRRLFQKTRHELAQG